MLGTGLMSQKDSPQCLKKKRENIFGSIWWSVYLIEFDGQACKPSHKRPILNETSGDDCVNQ